MKYLANSINNLGCTALLIMMLADQSLFAQSLEWAKSLGGTNYDEGQSITFDILGNVNVYVTGKFFGTVDFDPGVGTFF